MKYLHWKCIPFEQFNITQLYELIKFRIDIFVVEQQCPYSELDNKDRLADTHHIMAYNESKLVAYARLLAPGVNYDEVSIGRIAVHISMRREGIGSQLMQHCFQQINHLSPENRIMISAQAHLKEFYEKFDFTQTSECHLEDGITHIQMLKTMPRR